MAVVEIAKIQVRRGDARATGMPQLDTGEFGWAIAGTAVDSVAPQLYIGNLVDDGAFLSTNTRILTELDLPNIFASALDIATPNYTYIGNKPIPILNHTQQRPLQSKLDDFVTLRDFDVNANTSTSITEKLQLAIDDLYLNGDKNDPISRVKLHVAAGVYILTGTIYIPPYVTIEGAGIDKTIFSYEGLTANSMFQLVDQTSGTGSYIDLNSMTESTKPRQVEFRGMTISYGGTATTALNAPLIQADCATDSIIENVRFTNFSTTSTSSVNNVAINIRGLGAVTSRNLQINNCIFDNLKYAIKSDYDIEDLSIQNSKFTDLDRAVVFGEFLQAGNTLGPKRTRIVRNLFQRIARQALYFTATNATDVTNNVSIGNVFDDVGNNNLGDTAAVYSPVVFGTHGNSSTDDYFSRFESLNETASLYTFIQPIQGRVNLIDNKTRSYEFISAVSTGTIIKLANGTDSLLNAKIEYSIKFSGVSRWGTLSFTVSDSGANDIIDEYNFVGATNGGVNFYSSISTASNYVFVNYDNNSLDGLMTFQINQFY